MKVDVRAERIQNDSTDKIMITLTMDKEDVQHYYDLNHYGYNDIEWDEWWQPSEQLRVLGEVEDKILEFGELYENQDKEEL